MHEPLWMPKLRIEIGFRHALLDVAKMIVERVGMTTDPALIRRTLGYLTKEHAFQSFAEAAAMEMVTGLFADQGHTWREAARRNGKGRMLYEALQRELQGKKATRLQDLVRKVSYRIVTLPENVGKNVAEYIKRESMKGRRASAIEKELAEKFPWETKARAKLIARTQVSMASTDLTRMRAENLGLHWYVWRSVGGGKGDGRTRTSHRAMSGVLVNWNEPPAPEDMFPLRGKNGKPYKNSLGHYHAGQCPNCRCYAEPLLNLEQITWPARVYRHGKISRMKRKAFEGSEGL